VPEPIVGIVLAAGSSSRLGRPKQLEMVNGRPLIVSTVERVLRSRLDQVVVVVGAHEAEVAAAIGALPVRLAPNPDFASGQASSLVAGVRRAVDLAADAVIVVLGDQPGISPVAIDALIEQRRNGRARLGMALYGAQRGHPVMFGHELFLDLLTVTGDAGGRDIIERCRHDLVLVDGGREALPADLDRDADLADVESDLKATRE
jgi:molybdenum cofactor cytidylyltransferase